MPPQIYDEEEEKRRMSEAKAVEEESTDREELRSAPRPRRTFHGGRRGGLPTLGTNDENKENEGL